MSGESRRGRRIVSAAFVGVVSVFIVITTVQVGRGVFGKGAPSANGGIAPPPACVAGIARLDAALDRAMMTTSRITEEDAVTPAFAQSTLPEWNESPKVEEDCNATPEGKEAFAAILRLRRAEESLLHRQVGELSPMKQDVEAYLR